MEITDLMEPIKKAVAERNSDEIQTLMRPLQEKWYALATKVYQAGQPQDEQTPPNTDEQPK